MNDSIRQHLIAYSKKNNWPFDEDSLIDTLTEGMVIHEVKLSESRWWNNVFRVTEIDGMYIGYNYAQANRDETVRDLGWDFDPRTICEVKPIQKTVTVYEKVNPAQGGRINMEPNQKQPDELKATGEVPADTEQTEQIAATESAAQDSAVGVDSEEGSIEG